jgi:transcriptional regulator with XRE-family HTH domain
VPRIIDFLSYVPHYTTPRTLGERILTARRLLGLSQGELARRLGVDPSTLGRWERDEARPSAKLSDNLSVFLTPLPWDV